MPCPYANILGVRGQGFHSTRFIGLSLYDILGTLLIAIITSYIYKVNIVVSFTAWFVVGEFLHILFQTDTAFLEMIGMTPKC